MYTRTIGPPAPHKPQQHSSFPEAILAFLAFAAVIIAILSVELIRETGSNLVNILGFTLTLLGVTNLGFALFAPRGYFGRVGRRRRYGIMGVVTILLAAALFYAAEVHSVVVTIEDFLGPQQLPSNEPMRRP
jgi:hypothetical protein